MEPALEDPLNMIAEGLEVPPVFEFGGWFEDMPTVPEEIVKRPTAELYTRCMESLDIQCLRGA